MPDSKLGSIAFLLTLVLPFVTILTYSNYLGKQEVKVASAQTEPQNNSDLEAIMVLDSVGSLPAGLTESEPESIPVTITMPAPVVEVESEDSRGSSQQEQIDAYIHTIFGPDADMAIQVQRHECSPQHRMYPKCRLTTAHEDSIGIFQINIESATTKVHWAKIPGETKEAKVEWLMEPRNNTLMAYFIFSRAGNFCAWTWYKNNYCN